MVHLSGWLINYSWFGESWARPYLSRWLIFNQGFIWVDTVYCVVASKIFLLFTHTSGNDPIWRVLFKIGWFNQYSLVCIILRMACVFLPVFGLPGVVKPVVKVEWSSCFFGIGKPRPYGQRFWELHSLVVLTYINEKRPSQKDMFFFPIFAFFMCYVC